MGRVGASIAQHAAAPIQPAFAPRASLCRPKSIALTDGKETKSGRADGNQPKPLDMKQIGHAEGLNPKVRRSFAILSPAAFGIDLRSAIRAGLFLAAYVILEWVS